MVHFEQCTLKTRQRSHWVDITSIVNACIGHSGIGAGIVIVASVHTTAGITLNENADPDVASDYFSTLEQLIPQNYAYRHSEGNSDSHVKASLVGFSVTIPVQKGVCVLGTWQSIYFCEFDGPRTRTIAVTVMGE